MYAIYANIGGILMVNVTIYSSTMDPMGRHFLSLYLGYLGTWQRWHLTASVRMLATEGLLGRRPARLGPDRLMG